MTGPSTWRAMACTASKSPGLVIGKPASMTSTPSLASCWAISSFSAVFSEMPGDCSPSRSVVSKICTRSIGFLSVSVCGLLLRLCLRLGGPHASLPPEGEKQKKGEAERRPHQCASVPALGNEDHFADVAPLGEDAVRLAGAVERDLVGHDGLQGPVLEHLAQGCDPRLERPAVVPQREHVQADD